MIFFSADDIESQSESDFKKLKHLKLQKTAACACNKKSIIMLCSWFECAFPQLSHHL